MRPKWFSPCQVGRLDCLPLSIVPHLLSSLAPLLAREAQCDATTRELCETSSGDLLPGGAAIARECDKLWDSSIINYSLLVLIQFG